MRNLLFALAVFAAGPAFADDELNSRVQKLETMMDELRAERRPARFEILRSADQTRTQLGPAASKIYFSPDSEWQVGLSTELFTFKLADESRANVLGVAPVLAFRPHRRLIFNSQFLFENGGSESRNTVAYQKGQSIVQMAYLDWLLGESGEAGLRVGHQLVPLGWMNTRAEPVNYLSVLRPELERELIPGGWHENGVSLWVDRPRADIQIGVFNSLDARSFKGESFLAAGRSQGQDAAAHDLMAVFRVNGKNDWFLLGASIAAGNSAQNDPALRNAGFRMAEIHGRARFKRFELFGQGVRAQLDDAEAISIKNGTSMPEAAQGSMAQAAVDVMGGKKQLWLFARFSDYNLNARMPAGNSVDPAKDKQVTTLGAAYFPLPTLVIKTDLGIKSNAGGTRDNELSVGVGAVF